MATIRPNTPTTPYLDTFNNAEVCRDDRGKIATECAEKPEAKKQEERRRNAGLRRHIKKTLSALDSTGKTIYGYRKGSPAANTWMDDHCDGLWVKPQLNGLEEFEQALQEHRQRFENLGKTADYYLKNPTQIAESGFQQFARQAMEELGAEQVREMALQKLGKDALLGALPVGKGGMLARLGQVFKSGVSVASYLDTASEIASRITNPATLELLEDMKFLAGDAKDKLADALKVWQEKPDAAMAEAMSIAAYMDPCIRARKCQLVPFNATEKRGVDKGRGCCPGQTGHHLIPHNAAKDAGCTHQQKNAAGIAQTKNYSYGSAPTICLEGQDNNFGTHGRAHAALGAAMDEWRKKSSSISYPEMRDKALDSVSHVTKHCRRACLEAQLDSYYQNCGEMKPLAGTNSDPKIETEVPNVGDLI